MRCCVLVMVIVLLFSFGCGAPPSEVEKLAEKLRTGSDYERTNAATGLFEMIQKDRLTEAERELVHDLAIDLLRTDSSPKVRLYMLTVVSKYDTTEALNALESAGQDSSSMVRAAVAQTLGFRDPEKVENTLLELVADDEVRVRLAAARSLASHRRPAGILALTRMLESQDPDLRSAAIALLAKIEAPEAAQALEALMQAEETPEELREQVRLAIEEEAKRRTERAAVSGEPIDEDSGGDPSSEELGTEPVLSEPAGASQPADE